MRRAMPQEESGPEGPVCSLRIAAVWVLALAAGLATGCGPEVGRVVLVSIDTLRADHVSAYGGTWVETSNLDALARRGTRFETAIAPTPLTLPSHATLLTGLEPPRHGVRNNLRFRLENGIPTLAEVLGARGFATAAFVGAVVLDRQYGLERGFAHYDDQMALRHAAGARGFSERTADAVVDATLAWIDEAPERFFVWVHLYDPHANYRPPPEHDVPNHPYAGEIAFADAQLGRLVDAVETRWDDRSTLWVVTSDHGESLGEHGEITHALSIYDATQRVPLILAGPGVPVGAVEVAPVRLSDVAPTILARVGGPPLSDVDGRDALEREGEALPAYVETLSPQLDMGWSPLLGVRTASAKYIRAPRPELYDLLEDPGELHNLADARPDRLAELDALLDALLAGARPVEPSLSVDAARRAQLIELGYLAGDAADPSQALGRVGGIDPKDGLAQMVPIMTALTLLSDDRAEEALARLEAQADAGPMLDLFRSEAARRAGKPQVAERWARAALARVPDDFGAHVALAEALEGQGRFDEAQRTFEEAAVLNSAAAAPLLGQGRVAEARGEPERAAALYERAAASRGGSAEALWRLAALRIEARQPVGDLLARLPVEERLRPDAALRLARAEAAAGRRRRALARLQRALRASPDSVRLREALEELRGELG
jgi:arylsulfatase A-like enzyme